MFSPKKLLAVTAAAMSLSCAMVSNAEAADAPLTAAQVLQQFNLVVLGDATSNSHVDGRVWIGGNLTGGDFVQHPNDTAASNYAGLTVMGTASGVHVNGLGAVVGNLNNSIINDGTSYVSGSVSGSTFNGTAYVGGSSSGTNYNGGTTTSPTGLIATNYQAAASTNFGQTLSALSASLAGMSANSAVSISGSTTTFNAVADASGVAVFNLDNALSQQVFSSQEFSFTTNGASTIIINSSAVTAAIAANFLGGQAQTLGKTIIWNFYNATDLDISRQFGGSVLATGATLTVSQNIEGGVYVNSLLQTGEIHLQAFNGSLPAVVTAVPEPGQYLLLLAGLLMVVAVASTRRRQARVLAIPAA